MSNGENKEQKEFTGEEVHWLAEVIKYFQQNGFVQTYKSFVEECEKLGKPIASILDDIKEDDQAQKCKEQLMRLFDDGNTDFFTHFEDAVPSVRQENSPEFLKLEFSLQLHFAVFMLRHTSSPNTEQMEQNMQRFKGYLENRGAALSQEPDYLLYFALPYIQNPSQHSSFVDLFKDSWIKNVRQHLDEFLNSKLQIVNMRNQDKSVVSTGTFTLPSNDSIVTTSRCVEDMKQAFQMDHARLLKVQENYQKLMQITTELLSALETSVKGEEVNLSDVMDACLQAFPELFQSMTNEVPVAHNGNMNEPSDDSNVQKEERRSTPLVRSKTRELLLVSLDYKLLKKDLMSGAPRLKMFVLQALRWRLTKSNPELRRSVLSGYISNDLLGVNGNEYGDAIVSLIVTPTVELRQSMARLLNAFASLTSGRSYLSRGAHILVAVMDNITLSILETTSLDMSLATLQKLSLRRQMQTAMIEHRIIEWLLSLLEDEDSLTDYALEYAVALLMNLCLRTAGKQHCVHNPQIALKVLTNLLGHQNQEIIPYVNGTLYSLLSVPNIKREAQNMGLEEMLNCLMKESPSEMKRQLEFILRQMLAEDLGEETLSDYEDEDDDDEEQDILEEELDKDDLVVIVPGELQGEQLLTAHYSHANVSKTKTSSTEELLIRATTPRSQGLSLRRKSSTQMLYSELSLDSADGMSSSSVTAGPSSVLPNVKSVDATSPTLNVDRYASHMLNEVVGIDKPVAEATSFPPILPKEPQKFGSSSVNEFVVAFSSRPKIPRTPEHSARRSSLSPRSDFEPNGVMPSRDG